MNTHPTVTTLYSRVKIFSRFAPFILLTAILALPLFSASTASHSNRSVRNAADGNQRGSVANSDAGTAPSSARDSAAATVLESLAPLPFAGPETVAIYTGANCDTPAASFTLGQTVCATVTNTPLGIRTTQILRRVMIVGPGGYIRAKFDVPATATTATFTFPIPGSATSLVGGETIDNRGDWYAMSAAYRDGSPQAKMGFSVSDSDANVKVADLALQSAASTNGDLSPGENVVFTLYAQNLGPDPAQAVVITDTVPNNSTFVGAISSDANFECAASMGTVTCDGLGMAAGSLAKGAKVKFALTFTVDAGTPVKTVIVNLAEITSTTTERSTRDNLTKSAAVVTEAAGASTCTLSCPANVIATANTTVGGNFGALVSYGAAAPTGDCGAVSNSPASGSFFAVGTHTVTSSGENGGSCTFTVKVLGTPAPTISCPANKTVTAVAGDNDANVTVGTATFTTANTGTVVGLRTDSTPPVVDDEGNVVTPGVPKPLTDPYPLGQTGILWTVTDADGRTATCNQIITVNANNCGSTNDTQPPTITAPADLTVGTGPANTGCKINLDDELGQAETNDNNAASCPVSVTISGIPAFNDFAPGTYTLTYTATDGAGNTATDTQIVTVVDDTKPIIKAPADATYVCASEVPAANASQARGPVLDASGQFIVDANGELVFSGPAFENCGGAVVTVTETTNGAAGSAANPLVITRTFKATDSAGNFATDVQTITVSDGVAPIISAPPDVTAYTGPGATSCGTVVSNASLGTASASDNCSVTVTRSPSGNTFPLGTTDVIWTATDPAGNTATVTQHVTVIDNTPPVVTPPANITVFLPLNSTATSMVVNYPNPATATDNCAGTLNIAYSPASGSTFPVGTTPVTASTTDAHGNPGSATFTVTVLYNFTGFFAPVDNLPVLNVVSAGRGIPVKFSLSGNKGFNIFAANSPYSMTINCDGSVPQSDVEETVNAGSSSLNYDAASDMYNYVWKSENSWKNTCRQLVVKLSDGTEHRANFKFK